MVPNDNINQEIDFDTAALVASEFGVNVEELPPEVDPTLIPEIVDDPKHYQDAFNAVCKIADVMVWAPIANENGEVTMARTPLFTLLAKSGS